MPKEPLTVGSAKEAVLAEEKRLVSLFRLSMSNDTINSPRRICCRAPVGVIRGRTRVE